MQKADSLFREDMPDETRANYYYQKGDYALDRNDLNTAKEVFLKADSIATAKNLGHLILRVKSGLGNLYDILGDFAKAIEYQQYVLDNLDVSEDSSGYYSTLINISNSYSELGENKLALQYLLKAKRYFAPRENRQIYAIILNNIGELYRIQFLDYPAAIKHYLQAKAINEEIESYKDLSSNLNNIALAYMEYGMPDSALYFANANIELKRNFNDKGGIGQALYTRGTILLDYEKYDLARADFNRSLEICDSLQILVGVYYNHVDLAKVAFKEKEYRTALMHLNEAKKLNDRYMQSPKHALNLFEEYTQVYEAQGDYRNAFLSYKKGELIKDSLKLSDNEKILLSLKSEHEKDLALADNEVLRLKEKSQSQKLRTNRILLYLAAGFSLILLIFSIRMYKLNEARKKAYRKLKISDDKLKDEMQKVAKKSSELEDANTMKNQILSVMGHDLRSPLVGVAGLLSTISAEEITREELQELLAMLKTETDRSLLSLQNVLHWARLQMEDVRISRSELELEPLIKDIIFQYGPGSRSKKLKIEFENEMEQALWADENQFRSMVGNLLSNAIKFSPDKASILIKAERLKTEVCISVCDEGSGLSNDILDKLNHSEQLESKIGTRGERGTGIGLKIVYDFIKIHRGRLEFENREGGGTCAKLFFPLRSKLEA